MVASGTTAQRSPGRAPQLLAEPPPSRQPGANTALALPTRLRPQLSQPHAWPPALLRAPLLAPPSPPGPTRPCAVRGRVLPGASGGERPLRQVSAWSLRGKVWGWQCGAPWRTPCQAARSCKGCGHLPARSPLPARLQTPSPELLVRGDGLWGTPGPLTIPPGAAGASGRAAGDARAEGCSSQLALPQGEEEAAAEPALPQGSCLSTVGSPPQRPVAALPPSPSPAA